MATHSSVFAWEIPWMEEPGGPQSMGLQDLATNQQLRAIQRSCGDRLVKAPDVHWVSKNASFSPL